MQCKFCLNGKESLCTQFKSTNFKPGAFCEYLILEEGHLKYTVQKVPANLSNLQASFTEPVACCIKAIDKSGLKDFESQAKVLIIGLGSIGLIIGQLIKYYRPEFELTGLDLLEHKLELAHKLGLDQTTTELDKNYKADFVFLCAGAGVKLATEHAELGATIVVFSSTAKQDLAFKNNEIYYKELNILGSYSPNLSNLKTSLELLKNKNLIVDELITHSACLENLGATIAKCREEQGIKTYLKNS